MVVQNHCCGGAHKGSHRSRRTQNRFERTLKRGFLDLGARKDRSART